MKKIVYFTLFILIPFLGFSQNPDVEKRLKSHVDYLTSDKVEGRKAGTAGEKLAADYIYERLNEAGVIMLTPKTGQDFAILQGSDTLWSRNIVGIVEGSDKKLRNEYVVIGANFDHLGTNTLTVNGKKTTQIYRGADDNASGVACMIEMAERVAATSFMFKRSVIFIAFGAKEMGMAGSWYFVNRAFNQIDSVSLMINLDKVGRLGTSNPFTYNNCAPNVELNTLIKQVTEETSFIIPKESVGETFGSDYLPFYQRNIPVTLFSTGIHRDYHSTRDTPEILNYEGMDRICNFVYNYALAASNTKEKIKNVVYQSEPESQGATIYSPYEVDKAPKFFKGDERTFLEKWVYVYLKYPDTSLRMGNQGVVTVEFIVEADGSVSNVKVVKGIDDYIDAEVVKVVSVSPKWKAGEIGSKKVRVKYSLPVEFRLKSR